MINGAKAGRTFFGDRATAGNAILIATGGAPDTWAGFIAFYGDSTGGLAQVKVYDNDTPGAGQEPASPSTGTTVSIDVGYLDLADHRGNLSIGSLEGTGKVFLGPNDLTVGQNNLSTTFDGILEGSRGSITKVGKGKLTLTNANTYPAGTTVERGALLVRNTNGSGTGTGPVQVNAGALGGTGTIAGAVTIGTGTGRGAFLTPGDRQRFHALTIQSALTLKADATYNWEVNSDRAAANEVVALGVTITDAQCSLRGSGSSVLPTGTVFIVISNTSATPISGAFSNLPDGAIVNVNGNNLQASYTGGDGNDFTLKVVP